MSVCMFLVLPINVLLLSLAVGQSFNDSEIDLSYRELDGLQVLSRRKRFIIFPEGSSFQIVFCLTFPTVFAIGDIFLFGYTAALAYELPQDPYSPFRHHGDPLHRRADSKMIYFTDFDGNVLFKKKYERTRRPFVNPAFAKRSVDMKAFERGAPEELRIDRKRMHAQHTREFLKSEYIAESAAFHRSGRATLYPKIETVLQAVGRNGKHCVLRTLCQVGQTQHHAQGSFFEEIMRAVFTLPKGKHDEELKEYDDAHSATESCASLYPDCDDPSDNQLPTINY